MNEAQARALLPSLVADLLSPEERSQLLAFVARSPALEQERQRLTHLFQRVGTASVAPPAPVWEAIEATLARDAADPAQRVPTPVEAPAWRRPRERPGAAAPAAPMDEREALLFGKVALNWRLISKELLERALHYQRTQAPHLHLGEVLLQNGILTRAQVDEILAYQERIRSITRTRGAPTPSGSEAVAPAPGRPFGDRPFGDRPFGDGPFGSYGDMGGAAVASAAPAGLADTASFAAPPRPHSGSGRVPRAAAAAAPGSDSDDDVMIGRQIGGCRVLSRLGAGAMGAVYLARHESLQKDVVVKVLAQQQAQNPRSLERFLREARAAAAIEHANVIGVYDTGTLEEGLPYIVMQYVAGKNLDELVAERGKLPLREALKILLGCARGLHVAHQAGVIHRDVKASNIMVTPAGEAKVADFGLAKDLNSELKLTADGAMIGTPLYMAPEIGRVKDIDGRVDVYSLGVTLYYLLTGVQPFRGFSAMDILSGKAHQKLAAPEEHLPEISEDVRNVLGKMLARDRDERYADAAALVEDLERLDRGLTPLAEPGSGPWAALGAPAGGKGRGAQDDEVGEPDPGRNQLLMAGLFGVVLVILALVATLAALFRP
ncbi:MAG: protein kinase [Planctomycetota bacterium]